LPALRSSSSSPQPPEAVHGPQWGHLQTGLSRRVHPSVLHQLDEGRGDYPQRVGEVPSGHGHATDPGAGGDGHRGVRLQGDQRIRVGRGEVHALCLRSVAHIITHIYGLLLYVEGFYFKFLCKQFNYIRAWVMYCLHDKDYILY